MSKNSNLIQRLVLFVLALPALASVILFLPFRQHLVLQLACLAGTAIGSLEMINIIRIKGYRIFRIPSLLMAISIPAATLLYIQRIFTLPVLLPIVITVILLPLLIAPFFRKTRAVETLLEETSAYFLVMLYPGALISFIILLCSLEQATAVIILFFLTTYLNDSFAWLMGNLFGKTTRNILPLSPNKSLVGFLSGIFASVLVCVGGTLLFPQFFPLSIVTALILGLISGIAAIIGDLVESGFKRSADVKDSGKIIMGRGGLLDSIDSLLFTAPVFYLFFIFFTN